MSGLTPVQRLVLADVAAVLQRHQRLARSPGREQAAVLGVPWETLSFPVQFQMARRWVSPPAQQHHVRHDEPAVVVLEGVAADFDAHLSSYRRGGLEVRAVYAPNCHLAASRATVPLCLDHNEDQVVGAAELWQDDRIVRFKGTMNLAADGALEALDGIRSGDKACVSIGFRDLHRIDDFAQGIGLLRSIQPTELSLVSAGANHAARVETIDSEPVNLPRPHAERDARDYRARMDIQTACGPLDALGVDPALLLRAGRKR